MSTFCPSGRSSQLGDGSSSIARAPVAGAAVSVRWVVAGVVLLMMSSSLGFQPVECHLRFALSQVRRCEWARLHLDRFPSLHDDSAVQLIPIPALWPDRVAGVRTLDY